MHVELVWPGAHQPKILPTEINTDIVVGFFFGLALFLAYSCTHKKFKVFRAPGKNKVGTVQLNMVSVLVQNHLDFNADGKPLVGPEFVWFVDDRNFAQGLAFKGGGGLRIIGLPFL